jgi:N-acetylneuraminate lyase
MASDIFTGVWPAMVTPMHDDGRVRPESAAPLVEKFVREGAGGIYLCGSTGQGPLLTVEERKEIAEATVSAAAGRLPVMVHVGAVRLEECLELARHAAAIGADAVSSVPPIYYPPTLASAMEHYRRIGAATDLPFYAYNFSLPDCSVDDYVRALLRVPNVRGLKFTNLNMYDLARLKIASEGRLNVLSGADESFLAAQAHGADGAIGSTQNVAMPLFRAVLDAAQSGAWETARELMLRTVRAVHEVTIAHGVAGLHAILTEEGIPCGHPRHPLPPLDAAARTAALAAYRLLVTGAGE